jgi:hypothetical protein
MALSHHKIFDRVFQTGRCLYAMEIPIVDLTANPQVDSQ